MPYARVPARPAVLVGRVRPSAGLIARVPAATAVHGTAAARRPRSTPPARLRVLVVAAAVLPLAAPLPAVAAAPPAALLPAAASAVVTVGAAAHSVDSKVYVRKGESITVRASGQWRHRSRTVGPGGVAGTRSGPCKLAQLTGRVGVFGSSRCFGSTAVTFTSESAGYLLLWMNAGPGGGGAVSVDITGGNPASTQPSSLPRPPLADPGRFAGVCNPTFHFHAEDPEGAKVFTDVVKDIPAWFGAIARDVCSRLYTSPAEVPTVTRIDFTLRRCDGVAFTTRGREARIWACTPWLRNLSNSDQDITAMVTAVMEHEATHVFQHNGGSGVRVRSGVTEGVADAVRLSAGQLSPGRCSVGGRWDGGYLMTGCFLVWLDMRYDDFLYRFNQGLRPDAEPWSEAEFVRITGRPVSQLWAEYQEALRAASSSR